MSYSKLLLCLAFLCALPAYAQKETAVSIAPIDEPPTITVSLSPATLIAGQAYTINWTALRSTKTTWACTSTGSGYVAQGTVTGTSGSLPGIASSAWVGYPSNCVWRVSNAYGTETAQYNLVTVAPTLVNNARVTGVTVPTSMVAGRSYSVSVSMQNTGSTTWQPGVWKLGPEGPQGNLIWGVGRVELPGGAVAPNGGATFNFTVTAPLTPGVANFQWSMLEELHQWFGEKTGAYAITVTAPPPPAPTISVSHSKAMPLKQGETDTVSWSSTNAVSVSHVCTANQVGGYTDNRTLATSGSLTITPTSAWAGTSSSCIWTATGSTGLTAKYTETISTQALPPKPVISATHSPATLVSGQAFSMSWTSTDATSVSYSCSNAGGLVLSGSSANSSGTVNGTALSGWVNDAPLCTWTATGQGGSGTTTDSLVTNVLPPPPPPPPPAPVINSVSRNPATMVAGSSFTVTWSTSNATAMSYACVSGSGSTGYNASANNLGANASINGVALSAWAGTTSTCTWTATGAGGSTAVYRETVATNPAVAVEVVTFIHTDGLGSPVAKSDKNGNLISGSRTRYEPYGATAAGATPTIGFTGHVNDANTGLVYMQQRYYDPYAGRFLSTDPVVTDTFTGSAFNRYIYANNSPYRYIDPDGRQARGIEINCPVGNCSTQGESANSQSGEVKSPDWMREWVPGQVLWDSARTSFNKGDLAAGAGLTLGMITESALAGLTGGVGKGATVVAGQAGRFSTLKGVVGDGLTAHHMPQAALGRTSVAEGGALVMTTAEHQATRTFAGKGARTAAADAGKSFRDILAKDIKDVRGIVGSKYNEGLRDLIKYYSDNFPNLMSK
jgi:RHS repeat-associated protein